MFIVTFHHCLKLYDEWNFITYDLNRSGTKNYLIVNNKLLK